MRMRRSIDARQVSDQPVSPKLNELIQPDRRGIFGSALVLFDSRRAPQPEFLAITERKEGP
jgi:hypothetical protein